EEMGAVLRRAAFSPNIKERADCSAALFTPAGEMLVQAEHIPVHLGSMPASVQAAIDAFGDRVRPGDQVVVNDPFAGGTHLNDVTLVAPCFVDGRLVGWAANRAHHADVGGAAPGSIPADAVEIHQEGLRIPPTLLDDGVRRLLVANSRTPEERLGDLAAQTGANVVGVERLAEVVAGGAPLDEVVDYGERRMRAALRDLPDGTWRFEDVLDSTGAAPARAGAGAGRRGAPAAGGRRGRRRAALAAPRGPPPARARPRAGRGRGAPGRAAPRPGARRPGAPRGRLCFAGGGGVFGWW